MEAAEAKVQKARSEKRRKTIRLKHRVNISDRETWLPAGEWGTR